MLPSWLHCGEAFGGKVGDGEEQDRMSSDVGEGLSRRIRTEKESRLTGVQKHLPRSGEENGDVMTH